MAGKAVNFKSSSGEAKYILADVALDDREVLSQISDQLKNKIRSGVTIVIGNGEASHPVIVSVSKDLVGQIQAGAILKDFAAVLGGKGGGRPDFAQGAVPDRSKLAEADKVIKSKLGI